MRGIRRDRFAVAIGAVALVAVGLAFLAYRLATPSDHAQLDHVRLSEANQLGGLPVLVREPLPGGLRTGDVIVTVEGIPLVDIDRGPLDAPLTASDARELSYRIVRDGQELQLAIVRGAYPLDAVLDSEWSTVVLVATLLALAVFVYSRRPDDRAARAMLVMAAAAVGSTGALTFGIEDPDLIAGPALLLDIGNGIAYLVLWAALLGFAVEFAHPPRLEGWRRAVAVAAITALIIPPALVGIGTQSGWSTVEWLAALGGLGDLFAFPALIGVPVAFVLGYRANRDALQRSRIRWVAAAMGGAMLIGLIGTYGPQVLTGEPLIPWSWSALAGLPIPIAIAVAILRHGAFDLRIVVNRGIVYGALTLAIVGIYVGVVAAIGAILGLESRTPASLLAAAVVAVFVQPLRDALQRATNRLMFGDRDDPYAAISRLSSRLDASLTPEDVLPAVEEAVARALRVPSARVELDGQRGPAGVSIDGGSADGARIEVALVDQGLTVGRLVIARRPDSADLSTAERRLLDDLARQAASAAHAVVLIRDLQRAREREVRAREDERRLLRRQLHDEIGTALAALGLRIEAARLTVRRDRAAAAEALDDARAGVKATIDDIRRIVGRLASDVEPSVVAEPTPLEASETIGPSPAEPMASGSEAEASRATSTRFPRSALAALAAGFGIMALGLILALYRFGMPADGWRLAADAAGWGADWRFVTLEARWSGPTDLEPGDRIVAIDGRSIDDILGDALAARSAPSPGWTVGATVTYTVDRDGRDIEVPVVLATATVPYILGAFANQVVANSGFVLLFAIGLFVILRRPDRLPARLLWLASATICASLLVETVAGVAPMIADLWSSPAFWGFQTVSGLSWSLLVGPLLCHLFLAFPRPAGILTRHRRLTLSVIYGGGVALLGVTILVNGGDMRAAWRTFSLVSAAWMGILLLVAFGRLVREAIRERDHEARAQARWVAWGLGLMLVPAFVSAVLFFSGIVSSDAMLEPTRIYMLALPATLAIAIVQHRLFDIDVVINRTLVYGALTGAIVLIYVASVTLLGELFATAGILVSLVATGVVAVLVQPIRERLQRAANRLMYGERDEPYTVVSRLGQRLEATVAPDALLPVVADTLAAALRVPYVAVELELADGPRSVATTGRPVDVAVEVRLAFQQERVGRLLIGPRSARETFSPADRSLIDEVARHASRVAYSIRLRHDLDVSLLLIARARTEERRRIRRDLHDDLGPSLAAVALKLEAAADVATTDPERAGTLLEPLPDEIGAAVREIRRIVNDLRPPALDELGLVGALRQQIRRLEVDASAASTEQATHTELALDAVSPIPPLPAAVEVAAYRIVLEAVTNAVRHAEAHRCVVRLEVVETDSLRIEIVDDGRGIPDDRIGGIGLRSMRERAVELGGRVRIGPAAGGGTRIEAELPLPAGTALGQAA
jgi:signal transduction histidine kinase